MRETKLALGRRAAQEPLERLPSSFAADADLGTILFVWSLTHGFSTMLIDGQLGPFEAPPGGRERLLKLYSEQLVALLVTTVRQAGPA